MRYLVKKGKKYNKIIITLNQIYMSQEKPVGQADYTYTCQQSAITTVELASKAHAMTHASR